MLLIFQGIFAAFTHEIEMLAKKRRIRGLSASERSRLRGLQEFAQEFGQHFKLPPKRPR